MTPLRGELIPGSAGRILVVAHQPEAPSARGVLVVPAFAEEMNKSRRLLWETGRALRAHGLWTIVPDLSGTGDSEGEFAAARWELWIDDLARTVEWAGRRGIEVFDVLLVRLGAALFNDAQSKLDAIFERAVAWHPVRNGSDVIRQLLRIRSMAIRMSGGRTDSLDAMERSLYFGAEPQELSGYMVAPELAGAIAAATFSAEQCRSVREGLVLELVSGAAGSEAASPVGAGGEGSWRHERIAAERFWVAVEPGPNPALVDATVEYFTSET